MFSTMITPRLKMAWETCKDWFLPNHCLLCSQKTANYLCNPCKNALPILTHFCEQCAQAIPQSAKWCGKCISTPPPFSRVLSLYHYRTPIDKLIMQLKFQRQLACADFFAQAFIEVFPTWYANRLPDYLLPVPLHVKRLQSRGFNQALEMAKPISKYFNIPIDYYGIQRKLNTEPQQKLPAHKRQHNLRSAFIAHKSYANQHIVIVDDVLTTGSTVQSIANLLRAQGATRIEVICAARCSLNA